MSSLVSSESDKNRTKSGKVKKKIRLSVWFMGKMYFPRFNHVFCTIDKRYGSDLENQEDQTMPVLDKIAVRGVSDCSIADGARYGNEIDGCVRWID